MYVCIALLTTQNSQSYPLTLFLQNMEIDQLSLVHGLVDKWSASKESRNIFLKIDKASYVSWKFPVKISKKWTDRLMKIVFIIY